MTSVDAASLRSVPFLEGARPDVLDRLVEVAVEVHYRPGDTILQEGSEGRELCLILDGLVEVVKGSGDDEMEIARRGAGDFFGEMAFLEDRPRFATVRALEPTQALIVAQGDTEAILARQPELLQNAVRMMSSRLREADRRMIADLRRKNEALARAYQELKEAQAGLLEKERLEHWPAICNRASFPTCSQHSPGPASRPAAARLDG